VIYQHGETWWNNIDRGKLLRPPERSDNPTSSHQEAKQEELAKKKNEFLPYEVSLSYFEGFFNMP
jgi:hypothetical protein